MKLTFLLFIYVGLAFPATSQNQGIIDSLYQVLENRAGGDRFPALYELAFQHLDRDNEKALEIILKAEEAALLSEDSLWITKSKRVRGQILYRLQRVGEAIVALQEAMEVASRRHMFRELQMINDALGIAYMVTSRFDRALHFYMEGLEIARRRKDEAYIYQCLNKIGLTYYKLADFKKALEFYFQSLAVPKVGKLARLHGYVNIGLCYINLEEFSNAGRYLDAVSEACENECSNEVMVHFKFAVGLLDYMSNDLEKAEANFVSSLQYAKWLGDARMIFDNIYLLSGVYLKRDELVSAERCLKESLRLTDKSKPLPQNSLDLYKRFFEVYLRRQQFRKAAYYQSKYIELKDSIYSQEYTVRLMAKEVEFAQQQNSAKIEAQAHTLGLNEQIIQRQKIVNLLTGALALVVTILLVVLFRNYRRKEMANALLEQRVRARTTELEMNQAHLVTTLKEQQLVLNRTRAVLIDKINTVKGLCSIGHKEAGDKITDRYFIEIDETFGEMCRYLHEAFGMA